MGETRTTDGRNMDQNGLKVRKKLALTEVQIHSPSKWAATKSLSGLNMALATTCEQRPQLSANPLLWVRIPYARMEYDHNTLQTSSNRLV